jgi:hypothetical protein
LTLDEIPHALIRGVDSIKRVEIMDDRAKDQWWIDGSNIEIWLLLVDEGPGCFLRKGLA